MFNLYSDGPFICRRSGEKSYKCGTSLSRASSTFPFPIYARLSIAEGFNTSLPYIKDLNTIGAAAQAVNSSRNKAAHSFIDAFLPSEPSKNVDPGSEDYSVAIGLAW